MPGSLCETSLAGAYKGVIMRTFERSEGVLVSRGNGFSKSFCA